MKIVTVIGARPQFIKAATISRVIRTLPNVEEVIIHTGQHFDANMSDVFFEEMDIPKPDYNLEISSLTHGAMTGRMLEKIEQVLLDEKPEWLLVYGDTNSTLAGALAASKLHVKVAHVEAGLRSFNMKMPEEQNRILTDRVSTVLFCPTEQAVENLKLEGYDNIDIAKNISGDVMYDAALFYKQRSKKPDILKENSFPNGFVLSTIHRAENTDDPQRLKAIISALNTLHKKTPVVLPLHPRTKGIIKNLGLEIDFFITEPVGYLEMVYLLENCQFVMSDSGGVQKEAYFFNKQCLILRDETEWTELVKYGSNVVVGADTDRILNAVGNLDFSKKFDVDFYGSGDSAERIIEMLIAHND